MSDNSTIFTDKLAALTNDFEWGVGQVSELLEPAWFESLSQTHGLSVRAIRSAWQAYLYRRRIGRPILGPLTA